MTVRRTTPPTRHDIAKQAGVSVSTVGMILGGRGERYSKKTRRRVLHVAAQLNYRPNIAARSLKLNRSFLIGTLVGAGNRGIAMEFLGGLQSALSEEDYAPIVFSHNNVSKEAECVRRCLDRRVDGLIVNVAVDAAATLASEPYQPLIEDGFPLVEVFGRFLAGTPAANIDNVAAGRDATQHLLDLGHRRIVLLIHDHYDMAKSTGIGLHFDAWQRYFGYSQAMQAAGLQSIVITHTTPADVNASEAFFASGMASLDHVIGHETLPTAVVCYNDYQAYGLIRGCRLRNIPIPEQLSIVGYGDLELSQITSPTLTTLRVPAWQVGYQATRMLLDLLAHANVEETLVPSELRLRESTTRPRKHS